MEKFVEPSSYILVKNIPNEGHTFRDLAAVFRKYGMVIKLKLLTTKTNDGRTKKAFVEFLFPEHARTAVEAVNGLTLDGEKLSVYLIEAKCKEGRRVYCYLNLTSEDVSNAWLCTAAPSASNANTNSHKDTFVTLSYYHDLIPPFTLSLYHYKRTSQYRRIVNAFLHTKGVLGFVELVENNTTDRNLSYTLNRENYKGFLNSIAHANASYQIDYMNFDVPSNFLSIESKFQKKFEETSQRKSVGR